MRHVDHLATSGWTAFASVRSVLSDSGVPLPDGDFLHEVFAPSVWKEVDHACELLESRFRDCRYSDSVSYGPLLVPNPALLDVRRALDDRIRDSHPDIVRPDFVDARLPHGADATDPTSPWTLFAAAVSDAGPAMGSYDEIMGHDGDSFTVADVDTRELMTRQLWCSLVIQNLRAPDSELRDRWTFTLFAGEEPVEGEVVSGTVLHGQVRQRLGKSSRGSAPVRVRPALRIASAAS